MSKVLRGAWEGFEAQERGCRRSRNLPGIIGWVCSEELQDCHQGFPWTFDGVLSHRVRDRER